MLFSGREVRNRIIDVHDDVIKWKQFPRYWQFVRGIHRSPVNCPRIGQWCGALMFSLICVWLNGCVNNREAGDLRRYHAHHNVTVMSKNVWKWQKLLVLVGPCHLQHVGIQPKYDIININHISLISSFYLQRKISFFYTMRYCVSLKV